MNHIHVRIHRWVLWWLAVGVVCGVVALVNILFRDLTRAQDKIILAVGVLHWALGGLVCWAFDGINVDVQPQPERKTTVRIDTGREWHSASEFVMPGGRKSFLPPRY